MNLNLIHVHLIANKMQLSVWKHYTQMKGLVNGVTT